MTSSPSLLQRDWWRHILSANQGVHTGH